MASLSRFWDIPILLLLSLIWASAFTMIKIAVPVVGPVFLVFTRCLIGAMVMLFLIGIIKGTSSWPTTLKQWLGLIFVGLTSTALPFYLISYAEQEITSGMTAILMTTGPLVVIFLGHFLTNDEKINRGKLIGISIGFMAAIYLLRDGINDFNGSGLKHPLAAMGAAVCYALGGLAAKKLTTVSAEVIAFMVLASSVVFMLPFVVFTHGLTLPPMTNEVWLALVWLGVMPSGIAFYLRYFLIKRNGYGFVSYVGYLIPLFAIFIGLIILGEVVTLGTMLAMFVIILGLFFTRSSDDIPWSWSPKLSNFRARLN